MPRMLNLKLEDKEAVVIPDVVIVINQYINANSKTLENIEKNAFLDSAYNNKKNV